MRYLVIADIHSNIDALEAIQEPFDRLLVLGDLVDYGAAPEEAVGWVRGHGGTAVSGNHDFAMATGEDCRSSPQSYALSLATRAHFRPVLGSDTLEYLRSLPFRLALEAEGIRFHMLHATPRDPLFEYLGGEAPDSAWRSAVGDLAGREEWLFVGHTHKPFLRKVDRLTIVNPGSLGMPVDGNPQACLAVWRDGEVTLKRFPYDVQRAAERLRGSGLPPEIAAGMCSVLQNAGRTG